MSVFRFKQFEIAQDQCAMKVGTDATILGAWAMITDAASILDIGTGTGVLALMVAQRNALAAITALEFDEAAYLQAKSNFENSSWKKRLKIIHSAVQHFQTNEKFDVIISNPPFYSHDKHLSPAEVSRRRARSTETLTYDDLCRSVALLLKQNGSFQLIIPIESGNEFIEIAKEKGLFLYHKTTIFPSVQKPAKRLLLGFSNVSEAYCEDQLVIRKEGSGNHDYSPEFVELLKDFLIVF